jgi:hypothetical protein
MLKNLLVYKIEKPYIEQHNCFSHLTNSNIHHIGDVHDRELKSNKMEKYGIV